MTELSRAAQAVFNAVWEILAETESPWTSLASEIAAAALRAVVEQVLPQQKQPDLLLPSQDGNVLDTGIQSQWSQRCSTRRELLAIATELENTND